MDHRIGVAQELGQASDVREVILDDRRAEGREVLGAPRVPDRHDDVVTAAREDADDLAADEAAATGDHDAASGRRCRLGRRLDRRLGLGLERAGLGLRGRLGLLDRLGLRRRRSFRRTASPGSFAGLERSTQ
jgi:hypothetical protein